MIDYYTVTLNVDKEDVRGIWIGLALDEDDARKIFQFAYGPEYANAAEIRKGIDLEGFTDLVTESAKKNLLKFKSRAEDRPVGITYTNFVHIMH